MYTNIDSEATKPATKLSLSSITLSCWKRNLFLIKVTTTFAWEENEEKKVCVVHWRPSLVWAAIVKWISEKRNQHIASWEMLFEKLVRCLPFPFDTLQVADRANRSRGCHCHSDSQHCLRPGGSSTLQGCSMLTLALPWTPKSWTDCQSIFWTLDSQLPSASGSGTFLSVYRESVSMSSQPSVPTSALHRAVYCALCSILPPNTSHLIHCGAQFLRTSLEILHTPKTKELTVGFNRNKTDLYPIYMDGNCLERVLSFKFLGVHMDQWSSNTRVVMKKSPQEDQPREQGTADCSIESVRL